MTDDGRLRIEYLPLADLLRRRHPKNPKDHALEDLDESMSRFGYTMPVAVDESTGNLAAGHGRIDTLETRRQEGADPPDRVEVEDGEWLVPTIRGLEFEDQDELLSYLLADNALTEAGGWVPELLAEDVEDLIEALGAEEALRGTGLDGDRLDALLDWNPEDEDGEDVEGDDFDGEAPEEPESEPGEIYELGPHRLMCGDSFEEADVEALLESEWGADCVLTDPPYAIFGSASGVSSSVADDKMVRPFFQQLFRVVQRVTREFAHVYVHCDWRSYATLWEAARGTDCDPKNCLVWDKGDFGLGSMWGNAYELIGFWVHAPPKKTHSTDEETGQRTVTRSNILRYEREDVRQREHNAAKPVPMLAEIIGHATEEGETVVDLFGGSGSTLVACEKTGRVCRMMEIDPALCDVIRRRYAELTDQPELAP